MGKHNINFGLTTVEEAQKRLEAEDAVTPLTCEIVEKIVLEHVPYVKKEDGTILFEDFELRKFLTMPCADMTDSRVSQFKYLYNTELKIRTLQQAMYDLSLEYNVMVTEHHINMYIEEYGEDADYFELDGQIFLNYHSLYERGDWIIDLAFDNAREENEFID